jgi:ATP-dependent Clp protease ATP-binding subunit ClpA
MQDVSSPSPTPRYRQILDSSAEIARAMDHSYVGVEHLFLAIIRDPDAVPTQALASMISLDQVDAGLIEVMNSPSYVTPAPPPE